MILYYVEKDLLLSIFPKCTNNLYVCSVVSSGVCFVYALIYIKQMKRCGSYLFLLVYLYMQTSFDNFISATMYNGIMSNELFNSNTHFRVIYLILSFISNSSGMAMGWIPGFPELCALYQSTSVGIKNLCTFLPSDFIF
jgi:hypothetical protein